MAIRASGNEQVQLLRHFLVVERAELMEQDVRLTMIGRREGLPRDVLHQLDRTREETADNAGLNLCLAINYGGRTELADAARQVARHAGKIRMAVTVSCSRAYAPSDDEAHHVPARARVLTDRPRRR